MYVLFFLLSLFSLLLGIIQLNLVDPLEILRISHGYSTLILDLQSLVCLCLREVASGHLLPSYWTFPLKYRVFPWTIPFIVSFPMNIPIESAWVFLWKMRRIFPIRAGGYCWGLLRCYQQWTTWGYWSCIHGCTGPQKAFTAFTASFLSVLWLWWSWFCAWIITKKSFCECEM